MSETIWQNTDPRQHCDIYKGSDILVKRSNSKITSGWEVGIGNAETKYVCQVWMSFPDFPGIYEKSKWPDNYWWKFNGSHNSNLWDWKSSDPRWEMTEMTILIQRAHMYGSYATGIVLPDPYIIETNFHAGPFCNSPKINAGDDWPNDWKWIAIDLPE